LTMSAPSHVGILAPTIRGRTAGKSRNSLFD
jgi:hypothetical protein